MVPVQLVCAVEYTPLIASQFEWKLCHEPDDVEMSPPINLDIAMTLKKRDMKSWPGPVGWTPLNDAAFHKKTYQLRLEQGKFKVEGRTTFSYNPTYRYRLTWDRSPYPPLDEWKDKLPAAAGRYWLRKDFYKDKIEDPK